MVEEDKNEIKVPFPQANDFSKILRIIKIENEIFLRDNSYLAKKLDVSQRQINYYLAACSFLEIISNREFTNYGIELRNKGYDQLITCVSTKIISLPVFGDVFFTRFYYNTILSNEEIAELLIINYGIDNYNVAKRRASTVRNWINWIFEQRQSFITNII